MGFATILLFSLMALPSWAFDDEPRTSFVEEREGLIISSEAVKEIGANNFVEVEFKTDQADLSDQAKSSLASLIHQSLRFGEIAKVMVLAWADHEYPSHELKKLSERQVQLAARRSESIKQFLQKLEDVRVERVNMAQQPNVLSRWLKTDDAKLKNVLVSAGLPTTADEIQYPSKASHALVIVKLKW